MPSHKTNYIDIFSEILNLEGHLNRCIGSKVTAILLKGRILPTGGVASGRVCPVACAAWQSNGSIKTLWGSHVVCPVHRAHCIVDSKNKVKRAGAGYLPPCSSPPTLTLLPASSSHGCTGPSLHTSALAVCSVKSALAVCTVKSAGWSRTLQMVGKRGDYSSKEERRLLADFAGAGNSRETPPR